MPSFGPLRASQSSRSSEPGRMCRQRRRASGPHGQVPSRRCRALVALSATARSDRSASAWPGPPSAANAAAIIAASSTVATFVSSSQRCSHLAPARCPLARSRNAISAVSSSASERSRPPSSRAVISAATRLPCSSARRNTVRGWPCDVTAASPGPDGLASLLIGFGCLCALTGRVGVAQYQPERGSLRGVVERVHPPLDVLAFLSEFLGPNVELGDAGAGLADLGQELVQPGRAVGVDPRRFIVGRWLFHSGMTVSPRTRIVPDPSGSIAVRRGRGGRGATDIKLRERLKGDVSRAAKSLVGGQARWKRLSPAGNPGKRRSV